jgi:putative heme iron utilization protein
MSAPRKHGEPAGPARPRQEPLYDLEIPTPSHAEQARTLVASVGTGALSTAAVDLDGHPYGSLVLLALHEGSPVLLVSEMAEHTRNLHGSPRCSLLAVEAGPENPLALGRVTLLGTATRAEGEQVAAPREAFLQRHPDARFYADFEDFHFWRMQVTGVRYIGGFGRMSWVDAEAWYAAEPDPLVGAAARILSHMNEDHRDAMRLYCEAFSRAGAVEEVTMTGVDRYGFEMSVVTPEGPRPVRIAFSEPVVDAGAVRAQMVSLVQRARAQLGREPRS